MSSETQTPAFELKGNLLTLMVLQLFEPNPTKIAEQLAEKVEQAPHFFQKVPVIIDLQAVSTTEAIDLAYVVNLLRTHGLVPVALRGGQEQHHKQALSLNLGLLAEVKSERVRRLTEPPSTPTPPTEQSKIVTQPIRSGQQVVCLQGDLIVLAPVSHGAEILAQRHIHVYGALRGRALAGVNGDNSARIFCHYLDAELVSIAGQYQVNEELPPTLRGKAAQIYLEADRLKIQPLFPS